MTDLKLDLACGAVHRGHDEAKVAENREACPACSPAGLEHAKTCTGCLGEDMRFHLHPCTICCGFEGVDIARLPGVAHVHNLLAFPWPFADGSVSEIVCSHFVEHVPMLFWHPVGHGAAGLEIAEGLADWKQQLLPFQVDDRSVDLLLKFFDECGRILKPGGRMTVYCPQAHSDRAFQDPSHRRFLVGNFVLYLDKEWRKANGLEHGAYGIACDFPARSTARSISCDMPDDVGVTPEVKRDRANQEWNYAGDLRFTLVKAAAPKPATADEILEGALAHASAGGNGAGA